MVRIVAFVMLLVATLCETACSDMMAPDTEVDDVQAGCNVDTTLSCPGGFIGYVCIPGDNPEAEDNELSCSDARLDADNEDNDYCCFTGFPSSSTTCQADDDVSLQCEDDTFGFSCVTGDDPTTFDATVVCSDSSDTGAGESDFCCVYGDADAGDDGTAPTGCTVDTTLDCSGSGATGYACTIGDNPEAEDDSLSCSDPKLDSDSEDDYCCFTGFTGSSSTCQPDDDVTLACDEGYGFSCVTGDDPTTYDASLTCSDSKDTEAGASLFCCAY